MDAPKPGFWSRVQALLAPTGIEAALGRLLAPRMGVWLYVSVVLLIVVAFVASHMIPVIVYKVVVATLMGFVGDKVARAMEASNARPHELLDEADKAYAMKDMVLMGIYVHRAEGIYYRRTILIAAFAIAGALGS